ncbi:STAS domain-containing protein [Rhodococcus sp. NPDC055112]
MRSSPTRSERPGSRNSTVRETRTRDHSIDASVIWIVGPVDAASLPEFVAQLDAGIRKARPCLVVDLSKVTFLSVSGVEALAAARWRAGCEGVDLLLVGGPHCVDRALDVTGTRRRFRTFGSLRLAVEECRRMGSPSWLALVDDC